MSAKAIGLGALAALAVVAIATRRASGASSSSPAPSIVGLTPGGWYAIALRSSLDARVFGVDAAGMQAQSLLGRQGFDVRSSAPAPTGDPFAYVATGIYRGSSGALSDVAPSILLIAATPATPIAPKTGPTFIDARPVPLAPGVVYAGRASLSFPASLLVTKAKVASAMRDHGFDTIEVYDDAAQLPADWPADQKGGDVFARGRFAASSPATFDLPSQVVSVWSQSP